MVVQQSSNDPSILFGLSLWISSSLTFLGYLANEKKKAAANGPCMTQISQNIDNIVFVSSFFFIYKILYIHIIYKGRDIYPHVLKGPSLANLYINYMLSNLLQPGIEKHDIDY